MMEDAFFNLIEEGKYKEANKYIGNKVMSDLYKEIGKKAFIDRDLTYYGFFINLLLDNQTSYMLSEIHYYSALLLSVELCDLLGAYDLAYYHLNKAITLNPENKQYLKYLKHLETIPR